MNNNLLILGAGQYSFVVREIAEAMGCFSKIDMLDDKNSNAIGQIKDYKKYISEYSNAVVSIGNNVIRTKLVEELIEAGFTVPALIHPNAYISPSASIGAGTIVEAFVSVQANSRIGNACILSSTAVVNHNAIIGDGVHCDCGSIITARAEVVSKQKVYYGAVVYPAIPDDGEVDYYSGYNADIGI